VVANWAIWLVFAVEYAAIMIFAPLKKAAMRAHLLEAADRESSSGVIGSAVRKAAGVRRECGRADARPLFHEESLRRLNSESADLRGQHRDSTVSQITHISHDRIRRS